MYLLDTGVLTAYLRGRHGAQILVGPWVANGLATTSIVVYGEIVEYLLNVPQDYQIRETQLRKALQVIHPYPLTYNILHQYAELRRRMRAPFGSGLIGDIDTLIAATALVHNHEIVTIDADFASVPTLKTTVLTTQQLR